VDRSHRADPGVAAHEVHRPEAVVRRPRQLIDCEGVGDVGATSSVGPSIAAKAALSAACSMSADHIHALPGEAMGERQPDAAGREEPLAEPG